MDKKNVHILADVLIKTGLVKTQFDANKIAEKMVEEVNLYENIEEPEEIVYTKPQEIIEEKPVEEVEEIPKVSNDNINFDEVDWTTEKTNKIISNNEIIKTLEKIGKKELKDPNDSLNGAVSNPENYSKIENFYTDKRESNWLPNENRTQNDNSQAVNRTPNAERRQAESEQNPEHRQPENEQPSSEQNAGEQNVDSQTVNRTQNPESRQPDSEQNAERSEPAKMSPEEYTAKMMQGSLNDLNSQFEEEELPKQNNYNFQPQNQNVEALPEVVNEEKLELDIPKENNLDEEINVNTNDYEENNDFLSLKNEEKEESNSNEEEKVEKEQEVENKEEKTSQEKSEPQEEKKQGRWTEEEMKLRDQVDLSKVFNFGNRG